MRPGKKGRLATRVAKVVAVGAVVAGGFWVILIGSGAVATPSEVTWGYSANH
jgi:hypothetical protein